MRWTRTEGMVSLGDLAGGIVNSRSNAVSADGSVVVGNSYSDKGREAFRWTTDEFCHPDDAFRVANQSTLTVACENAMAPSRISAAVKTVEPP
jgi:uncharacterized membrane protein